jgi:hypothetical protein
MAVLSTVIGRGLASAKPGSPAEGYLYYSTDTGLLERYGSSTWETVAQPGGLLYKFSTTTTDADPGAGILRFNNGTPASVSTIYIDDTCMNSDADLGKVWDNSTGSRVLVTQIDDPAKYLLGEITADADGTGYWKLTVTIDASGTLIDNNATVSVFLLGGGSGGGATVDSGDHWPTKNLYAACSFVAGAVRQLGGIAVSVSTNSDPSDTERHCSLFNPTATALAYVYCNDLSVDVRQCPDLRWDGKIVDNVDGTYWGGILDQWSFPGTGVISLQAAGIEGAIIRVANGTDTNFKFITCDGVTETVTDTGVAVDALWHDFRVYTPDNGTTWKCVIDGTEVASVTSNVPNTTTPICYITGSESITSSTRSFHCSYFYGFSGDSLLGV